MKILQEIKNIRTIISPESRFINTMEQYMSQTKNDIYNLGHAIRTKDRAAMNSYSHRIKGGAQTLAADKLESYSKTLEEQALVLPYSDIKKLYIDIYLEWRVVRKVIQQYLQEIG